MSALFAGVDVGTTRTKAVVVDAATGALVAGAAVTTPQGGDAGLPVHSPGAVRAAALEATGQAVAALGPGQRARLAGLSVAAVGEEAVLVDAAGRPVGDVPTWSSGAGRASAARDTAALDELAPVTGVRHPEHTVHVLAWWVRTRPERARAAASFTDLGSWLLHDLGGSRGADDLVMDHSHASRTGLFDAPTRSWRPAALDVVGAGHLRLPRLVPSGTVVGHLGAPAAAAVGVAPGLPLVAGGHDHFCGALAAGARAPGDLFVSAGTSEAHVLVTGPLDPAAVADHEVGCFVVDGLSYLHAALPSGALFLTWTRLLGVDPAAPLDEVLGDEPVGSRGVRGSIGADRRLTLHDVPVDATAATLLRALVETTATASARLVTALGAAAGTTASRRLVAGAPVASAAWREVRRAVGQVPAVFVEPREATAMGAAHLAARGVTGVLPPPAALRPDDPAPLPERARAYQRLARGDADPA